jgi:hypothetical protein
VSNTTFLGLAARVRQRDDEHPDRVRVVGAQRQRALERRGGLAAARRPARREQELPEPPPRLEQARRERRRLLPRARRLLEVGVARARVARQLRAGLQRVRDGALRAAAQLVAVAPGPRGGRRGGVVHRLERRRHGLVGAAPGPLGVHVAPQERLRRHRRREDHAGLRDQLEPAELARVRDGAARLGLGVREQHPRAPVHGAVQRGDRAPRLLRERVGPQRLAVGPDRPARVREHPEDRHRDDDRDRARAAQARARGGDQHV